MLLAIRRSWGVYSKAFDKSIKTELVKSLLSNACQIKT